jgi:hypothetical protein
MDTGRTPPSGGWRTRPSDEPAQNNRAPTVDPGAKPAAWRPVRVAVAVAAIAALALTACGDDSDEEGEDEESSEESAPTTTTTQPSATDDEATAFAIVEDIFHERNELVDEIYQNPQLIEDPGSDHIDRIRALSTGDMNDAVDTLVDDAQEMLNAGDHLQATGDVMSDRGIYGIETADANTITFERCLMGDNQRVDDSGDPTSEPTVFGSFGPGTAERVDGVWKISESKRWEGEGLTENELTPGYLRSGFCDLEYNMQNGGGE